MEHQDFTFDTELKKAARWVVRGAGHHPDTERNYTVRTCVAAVNPSCNIEQQPCIFLAILIKGKPQLNIDYFRNTENTDAMQDTSTLFAVSILFCCAHLLVRPLRLLILRVDLHALLTDGLQLLDHGAQACQGLEHGGVRKEDGGVA